MRTLAAIALLAVCAACQGGYTAQSTSNVTVQTAPPSATLPAGGTQAFAAQVSGTSFTSVTWSVQEGAPGGGVSDGGVYTAPGSAGTYHVVATSVADTSKSGSSTVTVQLGVNVTPNPGAADVCLTAQFSASVVGSTNQAVTWSVLEAGGGTISPTGLYTAPSTPGAYHVVATSGADNTKSGSATVNVNQHILSVSVSPGSTSLSPNGTQTFTANVTNTCGTFAAAKVFRPEELKPTAAR